MQILGLQPRISKFSSRSLEQFFLTVGQYNFGNKYQYYFLNFHSPSMSREILAGVNRNRVFGNISWKMQKGSLAPLCVPFTRGSKSQRVIFSCTLVPAQKWHTTLKMFRGIYRVFTGKSESGDFKVTGIAGINAIPIVFHLRYACRYCIKKYVYLTCY